MAIKSVTKEEVVEFLNKIKKFFEPSPGSHAKLPIDITDFDRAIEAAQGGDFKPAIDVIDHAISIFDECEVPHFPALCLELLHALSVPSQA